MTLPPMRCLYCPPPGSDETCSRCEDAPAPETRRLALAAGFPESALLTEVTIDLSRLEGIWADVYARQDKLYARQVRLARREWRALTASLDAAALVAAFRRHALMIPGQPAPGTDHESPSAAKHHKAELRKLAKSMAAGFLAGLPDAGGYQAFLTAITTALAKGAGEGYASALAIAAAEAGLTGFGWPQAARDGGRQPSRRQVTAAAQRITAGAVTDIAVSLAAAAIDGLSAEGMTAAVRKILKGARSLTVFLIEAMAQALAEAMTDLYGHAGVKLLDWVTAADRKVCATCEGYEAKNPWRIDDFPPMPDHPGCRCVPMPAGMARLPYDLYAPYLAAAA